VSVTCEISTAGSVTVLLTWERGAVPMECHGDSGCCVGFSFLPNVEQAYFVVVIADALEREEYVWAEVLFGRLRTEAVRVIASMLPLFCCGEEGVQCGTLGTLEGGFRSLGGDCTCVADGVCGVCDELDPDDGLFVLGTVFERYRPISDRHWYGGCSDAVGILVDGKPWLCCPCVDSRACLLAEMYEGLSYTVEEL
jgi:hypothetical protein